MCSKLYWNCYRHSPGWICILIRKAYSIAPPSNLSPPPLIISHNSSWTFLCLYLGPLLHTFCPFRFPSSLTFPLFSFLFPHFPPYFHLFSPEWHQQHSWAGGLCIHSLHVFVYCRGGSGWGRLSALRPIWRRVAYRSDFSRAGRVGWWVGGRSGEGGGWAERRNIYM